ncbi:MAG TPA: lipoprotein [Burkholderiales bacterium]|nr:lipoprotein [Burkholderiales bacterium]
MRRLCLLLLLLLVLAACGQKGPLYLPGDQKQDRADKTNNK